jgi:hypothetical protein
MKNALLIFSLIWLAAGISSCDKLTESQKKADAVFRKITKIYTLNPDGSVDYQHKHELDLHSDYAFNKLYGESFIIYNPKYQQLSVNKSVTETAEGKKIPSPDNAYNEVLPQFASGAPPFHHLREMVVSHTGLEQNSTIHLDYEIHSKPEYMPMLMGDEILGKSSPIQELVIKVRFPSDKDLKYKLLNVQENLNIASKGSLTEYQWVFKDIPATSHEDHQPKFGQHLPRLIFSTGSLDKAFNYLIGQFSPSLPAGIEKSIDKAVKDRKNRIDSILAIQDMVVNHINHFDVPIRYTGFRWHSSEEVLKNNGGTTLEKTWLLASLLHKMGIKARPVALIGSDCFDETMGNFKTISEYYIKVPAKDYDIYLSATNSNHVNAKYHYAHAVHILMDQEKNKTEILKPEESISRLRIDANLDLKSKNKMTGDALLRIEYGENPYLKIQRDENTVNSLLAPGFSPIDIQSYQINTIRPDASEINYTLDQNINPKQQGDYWFLTVPEVNTGLGKWHLKTLTESRETPLELGWPVYIHYRYTVKLPESHELLTDNIDIQKKTNFGKLTLRIRKENRTVQIKRVLELNDRILYPERYTSFREMLNLWQKDNYRKLVFKQRNK